MCTLDQRETSAREIHSAGKPALDCVAGVEFRKRQTQLVDELSRHAQEFTLRQDRQGIRAQLDSLLSRLCQILLDQPLLTQRDRVTHLATKSEIAQRCGIRRNQLPIEPRSCVRIGQPLERLGRQDFHRHRTISAKARLIHCGLIEMIFGDTPGTIRRTLDVNTATAHRFEPTNVCLDEGLARAGVVLEV